MIACVVESFMAHLLLCKKGIDAIQVYILISGRTISLVPVLNLIGGESRLVLGSMKFDFID